MWKVFYGDSTTYMGDPWEAPARDCQMIAVDDPEHGWYLCRSDNYYWYLPATNEWQGGDIFGLFDYLIEPGPKKVLFGRTCSNDEFADCLTRALNDPDLPQKTAWRPHEHRR
jgi:hypothetical protein